MLRWCLLSLILISVSCTQEDTHSALTPITSSIYFPLDEGLEIEYEVLEIVYRNQGLIRDTSSYLLKEVTAGSFNNPSGDIVSIIDRYIKSNESESWSYKSSWQALIANNKAIRIEENRSYIKLQFPLNVHDSWDGNDLFDASSPIQIGGTTIDYYKNWTSKIVDFTSFTINEQSYDQSYVVSLADHENRLELRKGTEVYAPSLGMIYRELQILDTQCFDECNGLDWAEKAQSGHIFIQRIRN